MPGPVQKDLVLHPHRPLVDGALSPGALGDVRGDIQIAHRGDEVSDVERFVRPHGAAPLSRKLLDQIFGPSGARPSARCAPLDRLGRRAPAFH